MLSPQWLDELRSRVTLSSVVMRTTKLQRAGREWRACCPFHNEKTPSFYVNDEKGFYHCFGCQAHGDVIRWMTDQRGLAFMDAIKELASEAGIEVPAPDPRQAERAERQAGLHDVTAAAQDWFRANLDTPSGEKARAYLKSRGFDAHTIERFGFGYAPDGRQALKKALSRFDEAMLVDAGMLIRVDDKEPYDRFRDRLTMPIHDPRGRVIGFAARILDAAKKDAPKYLNSPDTPLFDKGRTLFSLHRASPAARKSGRVVVVEGQMDVIALAAAGIEEAVAPMGTALTEHQIEMLWRLVDKPILCFDGDAAGQRAAMKAAVRALPLLRPGHSLQFVTLPAGLDPDDLLRTKGRAALEQVLLEPAGLLDQLWQYERDTTPLLSPEDKAGLKARLLERVEAIQHPDIKALYRRELLKRYSEYAFPARDWSAHSNVRDITSAKNWKKSGGEPNFRSSLIKNAKPSGSLLKDYEDLSKRERHLHRRLGAAITAGLLVYPEFVIPWAETLVDVPDLDPRLDAIIEAAYDVSSLDRKILETILASRKLQPPVPAEWDNLRFPFAWPPPDGEHAENGLEKAIRLYAGVPQVRLALRRATEVFAQTFSDEAWKEQQRLRERAVEFNAELRQMAAA